MTNQSKDISRFEEMGNSLVIMAINGKIEVLLGIRVAIRPNTLENLNSLKKQGIKNDSFIRRQPRYR